MNQTIRRVLIVLIALMTPFFLMMTSIRLLFTPLFLQVEYRMPGFPEDQYGFGFEERMHWARVSLEYLLNNEGIDYLGDQRLADGSPLYGERELSHMVDVKVLVQQMLVAWTILLVVLALLLLWAWRGGWLRDYARGLANGGKLTLGLVALILAGVAISFRDLFTYFHKIFFVGDTWLFNFSDTLIRLFPIRFWQDGFILMGMVTILGAVGLIVLGRSVHRRDAESAE